MTTNENKHSLARQAYQHLHREILTCVLAQSERELANRYGINKTPIREALAETCYDGLMQRLPGRGYMVAPITVKDIQELFDLLLILEVAVAERAAQNPSTELPARLKEMSEVSYDLKDHDCQIKFLKTNRDFHITLAEATNNRRLVSILEDLFNEMERFFHLGLRLRDSSREIVQEHHDVVEAFKTRDSARVGSVIARQLEISRDRIMEAILEGAIQSVQISV